MATYKGFSTISDSSQKKFTLTDNGLIKQDLMNALMTRRGSRVMQPNFGCIVWEKLFDNLTATDLNEIGDNITLIVQSDPRLSLQSLDITPGINSITVTLGVQYNINNELDQLILNFNSNGSTLNNF